MKYIRNIAFLLIIINLLINNGGNLFYFYTLKNRIKQEVKSQIRHNKFQEDFTSFELNKIASKIKWLENGKEFQFDGQLYDVIKFEKVGKKVLIKCINDKKEKSLIDNFIAKTGLDKVLFKLLDNLKFNIFQKITKINLLISLSFKHFVISNFRINFLSLEIKSPPPKFFS